jgi:hypothetical protein
MMAHWRSGGIASRILGLGTRWKSSASRPSRFNPRERASGTHWIGGWVGPRGGMDTVSKRKIPLYLNELNMAYMEGVLMLRVKKSLELKYKYVQDTRVIKYL